MPQEKANDNPLINYLNIIIRPSIDAVLAKEMAIEMTRWATDKAAIDKQAYTILLTSEIISEDKCPKCNYVPILSWFNYCPMCTCSLSK